MLQTDLPVTPVYLNTLTSALCNSIADLFDDPLSSDVAIKAGDATVQAHKAILAVQLPSFKAMFQVSARWSKCIMCSWTC